MDLFEHANRRGERNKSKHMHFRLIRARPCDDGRLEAIAYKLASMARKQRKTNGISSLRTKILLVFKVHFKVAIRSDEQLGHPAGQPLRERSLEKAFIS